MTSLESKFQSYSPFDFIPGETFRMMWASEAARLELSPKIFQYSQEFISAELSTVIDKRRNACIQTVPLGYLKHGSEYMNFLQGMGVSILDYVKITDTYANAVQRPDSFSEAGARILISNDGTDNLGYPKCCQQFFEYYWEKLGHRDTIPFQLHFEKEISNYYPCCNILLKGLGLRAVPHLPCSMTCEATNEFAYKFGVYLSRESRQFLNEMLTLETNYSCYHGYAEVQTEYFKLMFNSLPLGSKYECKIKPIKLLEIKKSENGFTSIQAEEDAHFELIDGLSLILLNDSSTVLDLGCGDGTLLRKIGERFSNFSLEGVEINEARARIAAKNLSNALIYNIDINDFRFTKYYDAILIAAQRFQEMDAAQLSIFMAHLSKFCKYLTVYDYTGTSVELPMNFTNSFSRSYPHVFLRIMVPYAPAGTNIEQGYTRH